MCFFFCDNGYTKPRVFTFCYAISCRFCTRFSFLCRSWLCLSLGLPLHSCLICVCLESNSVLRSVRDGGCVVCADSESDSQSGWTALMNAAGAGRAECVRLLIDAGASIEAKSDVRRQSLLCCWHFLLLQFLPPCSFFWVLPSFISSSFLCC